MAFGQEGCCTFQGWLVCFSLCLLTPLAVFLCPSSCISSTSSPLFLVLVSLGGPFLLGCQGLCSQCGPIRSILLSLLPESADPFQEIWVVLLWDDLEEGGCVVSGKVWAEEKSLLVERILVSQGMWHQAAPGIKGL